LSQPAYRVVLSTAVRPGRLLQGRLGDRHELCQLSSVAYRIRIVF